MFVCLLSKCSSCSRSSGSERNKNDIWSNVFCSHSDILWSGIHRRYERLQSVVTASCWYIDRQMQPGTARPIMAVSGLDKPFNVSQSSTARQTHAHPLNSTSVSLAWKKKIQLLTTLAVTLKILDHSCASRLRHYNALRKPPPPKWKI